MKPVWASLNHLKASHHRHIYVQQIVGQSDLDQHGILKEMRSLVATFLLQGTRLDAEGAINKLVKSELTENMFSAIASLVYNIGTGNFQRSTLKMKLNRGEYENAADEFGKWRKAGGRILKGLVRRRAQERELFLTDV